MLQHTCAPRETTHAKETWKLTFATVLFHTVTSWPDLSKFITMPWPMMPSPKNPMRNGVGMTALVCNLFPNESVVAWNHLRKQNKKLKICQFKPSQQLWSVICSHVNLGWSETVNIYKKNISQSATHQLPSMAVMYSSKSWWTLKRWKT